MAEVDVGAVFDEHMADEFVLRDVDATMATMTDDPVVLHVPTSTGGGRALRFPLVAIVGFRDGKVASEHLDWDQATVLVQTGLLDAGALPVRGVEQSVALEAGCADNELLAGAHGPT